MACECQEIGDEPSEKKFVSSAWDEDAPLVINSRHSPHSVHESDRVRNSYNKSVDIGKPASFVPSKKGVSKSGSTITDGTHPNGNLRSFTDLPAALVFEILHCLDAKELGVVSCVSTLLNKLATDHHGWKDIYCERWGLPIDLNVANLSSSENSKSWKEIFVEREFRSKSFMGRFSVDSLHGHTEAVRAVFLLQSAKLKLIFTGGYDSVIRMWDMEEGLSIAVSRSLGCTIRAITADTELLVVGGTDAFLRCWRAIEGHPHLFDIIGSSGNQNSYFRLWGHEGPVTCLALDSSRIYSGSWDMSVRIWDRTRLKCLKTLRHSDWVWSLSPRGKTVASTAGRDVYIWDIESGNLTGVIYGAHVGNAYSLTRSYLGDLLFTGGEDGAIHMYEVRDDCDDENVEPTATWIPHTGPVNSLAFEFPWIVSSSSDGRVSLIDVRKLLSSGQRGGSVPIQHFKVKQSTQGVVEPPQRMLHGSGCNLFSVEIGADRIFCGGEDGVIRVWNFSQALEIEKRVQALRSIRLENRMRRRRAQGEMNGNGGRPDKCSVAAKRNALNGDCSGVSHNKRGLSRKLRA